MVRKNLIETLMRALKVRNRLLTKFEFIPLAVEDDTNKVAVRSLNAAGSSGNARFFRGAKGDPECYHKESFGDFVGIKLGIRDSL